MAPKAKETTILWTTEAGIIEVGIPSLRSQPTRVNPTRVNDVVRTAADAGTPQVSSSTKSAGYMGSEQHSEKPYVFEDRIEYL